MKIITHNGSCHFDEYLAIVLVVAKYKIPENEITIFRRPPTEKELENPNIWVIDVGKKLEPEKLNFDHHQYSGGDASFILIAKHFRINDICSKFFKWWYPSNEMDTIGPKRFSENLGLDKEIYYQFQAPLQGFLLKKFERKPNDIFIILKIYLILI